MRIHIKALEEKAPRSGKPLFELWFDGVSQGICSEKVFNVSKVK